MASNNPQLSVSIGWIIVALHNIVFIYQDQPIVLPIFGGFGALLGFTFLK